MTGPQLDASRRQSQSPKQALPARHRPPLRLPAQVGLMERDGIATRVRVVVSHLEVRNDDPPSGSPGVSAESTVVAVEPRESLLIEAEMLHRQRRQSEQDPVDRIDVVGTNRNIGCDAPHRVPVNDGYPAKGPGPFPPPELLDTAGSATPTTATSESAQRRAKPLAEARIDELDIIVHEDQCLYALDPAARSIISLYAEQMDDWSRSTITCESRSRTASIPGRAIRSNLSVGPAHTPKTIIATRRRRRRRMSPEPLPRRSASPEDRWRACRGC